MFAVIQHKRRQNHQNRPQNHRRPIDSIKRLIGKFKMMNARCKYQQHNTLQSNYKIVHQPPIAYISKIRRQQILKRYCTEDYDVKNRKKYLHIAFGSHPKLDIAHTLKRTLNFGDSLHKTYKPHQRQKRYVSRQ